MLEVGLGLAELFGQCVPHGVYPLFLDLQNHIGQTVRESILYHISSGGTLDRLTVCIFTEG